MGSQYPVDPRNRSHWQPRSPREGPIGPEERIIRHYAETAQSLLAESKFTLAARVAIGATLRLTGTDTLAGAAIAAAKGYQDARERGIESGIKTAVFTFATGTISGGFSDFIASTAVDYAVSAAGVQLLQEGRDLIEAAVASSLEEIASQRKSSR